MKLPGPPAKSSSHGSPDDGSSTWGVHPVLILVMGSFFATVAGVLADWEVAANVFIATVAVFRRPGR